MRSLRYHTSRRAITLLEIAVLVAFLVILGWLLTPRMGCSPVDARRSLAGMHTKAITNAIRAFEYDYLRFPAVAEPRSANESFIFVGDPRSGAKESNAALFDALRAIDRGKNSSHSLNPRKSKYFDETTASIRPPRHGFTDGKDYPPDIQGQLLDPWGNQYCVVMATNGDGVLDLRSIYSDLVAEIRLGCVAFSLGKDGTLGSPKAPGRFYQPGDYSTAGDIVSWE